ncbi:MAG: selenide, water dikinase [Flavipsychrobacter sp.]|nr:selenide, water dikinase [Flavipsychrobacter sp.]
MNTPIQEIKLTQYSRSAGCGCKIAPAVLQEILGSATTQPANTNLLVGNATNDDAAAYDLGNGTALIATTDFFMPIVDDAFDFGRIAAANAISDVYAMGGKPIMAIAILGWPVDKLPAALAQQVLEGARAMCAEAGIPLAGGHSIDSTEPIFGLSVNGTCAISDLKKNNTAHEGDLLFLTKPIGVGILATAQKRGLLTPAQYELFIKQLTQLNSIGAKLGNIPGVTAMTDVTGFGLAGHLTEMAEGAGLAAELYYSAIPVIDGAKEYLAQRVVPDATYRNWNAYSTKIAFEAGVDVMQAFSLLPDPQTNGGLLIAVSPAATDEVIQLLTQHGLTNFTTPIGRITAQADKLITIKA